MSYAGQVIRRSMLDVRCSVFGIFHDRQKCLSYNADAGFPFDKLRLSDK